MSKVLVTEGYLEDIADAIRSKAGGSSTYTPAQMASAISNIPTGGDGNITYSTAAPTSAQGSDGDTWCQYALGETAVVSISGGYNGGAVLTVTVDNVEVWRGVGSSPYNDSYTVTTDIPSPVVVSVTPPANHTDALLVSLTFAGDTRNNTFMHNGANSSYGYGNQSATETWSAAASIVNLYIKQSGAWKTTGDDVVVS